MTAAVGHNSKTSFAQGQLKSFVERVERLEEEKKAIAGDQKEVFAEAKSSGFDVKILRKVLALRKKSAEERQEEEAMLDLYLSALGMQPDLFDQPAPPTMEEMGENHGREGLKPAFPEDTDYMAGHSRGSEARLKEAAGG